MNKGSENGHVTESGTGLLTLHSREAQRRSLMSDGEGGDLLIKVIYYSKALSPFRGKLWKTSKIQKDLERWPF